MRRALAVAAIAVAAVGAIAIRVVVEGRHALAEGDAAYGRGQLDDAIAHWEAAGRWYLPMAPHVAEAYARLENLASVEPRHALAAWRAVRSAAIATAGLWAPHDDRRRHADAQIAVLASRDPGGAPAGGADAAARHGFHVARLDRPPRPRGPAVVVACLGVATWLAGLGIALRRGFDQVGGLRRAAVIGAVLAVVGVVGWTVGLYNA